MSNIVSFIVSKLLVKLFCSFAECVADDARAESKKKRESPPGQREAVFYTRAALYYQNYEVRLRDIRGRVKGLCAGSAGNSAVELLRIRVQDYLYPTFLSKGPSFWRETKFFNVNIEGFLKIFLSKGLKDFFPVTGLEGQDLSDLCYILMLQEAKRMCDDPEKTASRFRLRDRVYWDDGPLVSEREDSYSARSILVCVGSFKSAEPYIKKFLSSYPRASPWFKRKSVHYPLESIYLDFAASSFYKRWRSEAGDVIHTAGEERTKRTLTFLIRQRIKSQYRLAA